MIRRALPFLLFVALVVAVFVVAFRPKPLPAVTLPVEILAEAATGFARQLAREHHPVAYCDLPGSPQGVAPCVLTSDIRNRYRRLSIEAVALVYQYWDWDVSQVPGVDGKAPSEWAMRMSQNVPQLSDADLAEFVVRVSKLQDILVGWHKTVWGRAPPGFTIPSWDGSR